MMALLYHPGADVNRIYYGSDTHAQGLLLGSALGLLVAPSRLSASVAPQARRVLDLLGGGAIATLVVIMVFTGQGGGFTWLGGMVLVVVLAGIAAIVAAHPASRMSTVLAAKPLRWLGTRSYSVYLWHWPILDLTRPRVDLPVGGLPLGLLRLVLILGISELSFRYIERPWRSGEAQRAVRTLWAQSRRHRQAALAGASCVAVAVVALVIAAPSPKPPPSIEIGATAAAKLPIRALPTTTTIARRHRHRHRHHGLAPSTTTPSVAASTASSATTATTTSSTSTTPTTLAAPVAIIRAPPGRPVLAIGDSVMLGSSVDLNEAFGPAITVDAAVGRQVSVGIQRLREYKAAGRLHDLRALVIGLGTNGPFEPNQMRQLVALCRGVPKVVVINVRVPDAWQSTSNKTIESVAHRRGFTVINWYAASADQAFLYPDETHPDPAGQVIYTNLVVNAVAGK
jgi:hypothetical protein